MSRSRFHGLAILSVALLASQLQIALSQNPAGRDPLVGQTPAKAEVPPPVPLPSELSAAPAAQRKVKAHNGPQRPGEPADSGSVAAAPTSCTCVVYSLRDMGDDAGFCKWIAESIPDVIQPGSWMRDGGSGKICYHADGRIMVVHHSPAVHTKIEAYLSDLKKAAPTKMLPAMAASKPACLNGQVVQAAHTDTSPTKPMAVGGKAPGAGYPVPAPVQQPKHLFHFVIRYEGDGIDVDSMVSALAKQMGGEAAKEDGAEKAKPDAAKGPTLGQLLHLVVRYEGEGIIDSNVASLLRDLYGAGAGRPPASCVPVDALGGVLTGGVNRSSATAVAPMPAEEVRPASATTGPVPTAGVPVSPYAAPPAPSAGPVPSSAPPATTVPPPTPGEIRR
jgi:hypothetical protein